MCSWTASGALTSGAILTAMVLACGDGSGGSDPPPDPPPPSATIQVLGPAGGNRFSPTTVTTQAGETVAWVWPSTAENHNVLPDGTQPTSSGTPADGPNEYRFTFTTAGTYAFHCGVHGGPDGLGMSGTVVVEP